MWLFPSISLPVDHRLILALFLSVLLHMAAVLSIHRLHIFTPFTQDSPRRLEVTLLPKEEATTPQKAQQPSLIAQAETKIGGGKDETAPLLAPSSVSTAREKMVDGASPPARTPDPAPADSSPRLSQEQAPQQASSNPSTREHEFSKMLLAPQPSARELIAALEGRLAKGFPFSLQQPRKRNLDFRTKDYTAIAYLDTWCKKIERVGKMNYPEQAKRQGLSGSLSLEVDLNPDGSLADVVVRRSSGYPLLDEAAVRIVQLAAPFSKVPESILQGHDILSITRRWQFHSNTDFRAH